MINTANSNFRPDVFKKIRRISILFDFQRVFIFYIYVVVFSFQNAASLFSPFKFVFNGEQITKARNVICKMLYRTFLHSKRTALFEQRGTLILVRLFQKHDADVILGILIAKKKKKEKWTRAFFKTFFFFSRGLCLHTLRICEGLDFISVLKFFMKVTKNSRK